MQYANRMSGNLVQMEWTKPLISKFKAVDVLPHTNRLYKAHQWFDTGLFVWDRTYRPMQVDVYYNTSCFSPEIQNKLIVDTT